MVSDVARRRLEDHVRTLRIALDILIVCDLALGRQGAEQDEEIANILRYCGSERLSRAVDEMEVLAGGEGI